MLSSRRELIAGSLAALPFALAAFGSASASPMDPAQTTITLPDKIPWIASTTAPAHSIEVATLFGDPDKAGPYLQLAKWYPGYMSAPHQYDTDRICMVVSGTWWCNSGADFDPAQTKPAPAGSYVHRFAHTPHYDGVKGDAKEPAVIALFGIGPVNVKWIDGPGIKRV